MVTTHLCCSMMRINRVDRQTALHAAWITLIVILAAWFSWFFRFAPDVDLFYLDRWTGSVVIGDLQTGYIDKRASLRNIAPKADEFLRSDDAHSPPRHARLSELMQQQPACDAAACDAIEADRSNRRDAYLDSVSP